MHAPPPNSIENPLLIPTMLITNSISCFYQNLLPFSLSTISIKQNIQNYFLFCYQEGVNEVMRVCSAYVFAVVYRKEATQNQKGKRIFKSFIMNRNMSL